MEIKSLSTTQDFENAVKNGTTLVDFYAPWCAPCKAQSPIIHKLAEKFEGKVSVNELNVDENQDVAVKLGVQSIPTLILFKNGKEVQRFVGLQSESTLSETLEKNV